MLFVVAWPVLSEADEQVLRRLRARYHPREAELIGPHFKLVFAAPIEREDSLRSALEAIDRRRFWFMIDRIARSGLYLYAESSDGGAELSELYEVLNPTPADAPFQPHITLGLFERAAEAEQVARIVERQHFPMHGRVEELALLRRDGNRLETLETVRLSA